MRALVILMLSLVLGGPAAAGDAERGKVLHQKHCFGCHDTGVYTRENRMIHTYGDLKNRVKFCEGQNGLGWNDEQIEDVATYLDQAFYGFDGF